MTWDYFPTTNRSLKLKKIRACVSSIYRFCIATPHKTQMEMAVEGGGPQVHKKVMVAIDENECSYHALMWVLHNLKESIGNSPLVIFNAQPPPYRNNTFAASLGTARMYCPVSAGYVLLPCLCFFHFLASIVWLPRKSEVRNRNPNFDSLIYLFSSLGPKETKAQTAIFRNQNNLLD